MLSASWLKPCPRHESKFVCWKSPFALEKSLNHVNPTIRHIQHIQHIQHRKLLTMLFDKVNVRTPAAKSGWLWFCGSQLDSLDMTLELRWQERDSEPLSDVDSSEDS